MSSNSYNSSGGHSSHYKDFCRDLKHELKRKKRDIDDLEDQLKREEQDGKKLKSENHDLWKLYYGLQQELTGAYERNTKIQGDKATLEALFERERQDWERQRLEMLGACEESSKLKEALCNMQKDKLAMQKKFNDLVVENKTLKEKEREIEPKLREFEELKKKLSEFENLLAVLQSGFAKQRNDIKEATLRKDQVDSSKRWNELLKRELDQKTKKINQWDTLLQAYQNSELKCAAAETRLKPAEDEAAEAAERNAALETRLRNISSLVAQCMLSQLYEIQRDLRCIRNDVDERNSLLVENFAKIQDSLKKHLSISSTTPANDDVVELSDANLHASVNNNSNYSDSNDTTTNVVDGPDEISGE